MSTNGTTIAKTATATDSSPTTAIPTTAIPTTAIPTTAIPTTAIPTTAIGASSAPEQLTLLSAASVPLQFRLDERTRRTGLQHVAALRAQMAAQAEARNLSTERKRTPGRSIAA